MAVLCFRGHLDSDFPESCVLRDTCKNINKPALAET